MRDITWIVVGTLSLLGGIYCWLNLSLWYLIPFIIMMCIYLGSIEHFLGRIYWVCDIRYKHKELINLIPDVIFLLLSVWVTITQTLWFSIFVVLFFVKTIFSFSKYLNRDE